MPSKDGMTMFVSCTDGPRMPLVLNWDVPMAKGALVVSNLGPSWVSPFHQFAVRRHVRRVVVVTHGAFPEMSCCMASDAYADKTHQLHFWAKQNLYDADPYTQNIGICKDVLSEVNTGLVSVYGLVLDQISMQLAPVFVSSNGIEVMVSEDAWMRQKAINFAHGIPGIRKRDWPVFLQGLMTTNVNFRKRLAYVNAPVCHDPKVRRIVVSDYPYPPEAIPNLWLKWRLNGPNRVSGDQYSMVTWTGSQFDLPQIKALLALRMPETEFIVISETKEGVDEMMTQITLLPEFDVYMRDQTREGGFSFFVVKE